MKNVILTTFVGALALAGTIGFVLGIISVSDFFFLAFRPFFLYFAALLAVIGILPGCYALGVVITTGTAPTKEWEGTK